MSALRLPGCGLELHAIRHGRAGATPVLALHGWLDNAATFDALAPRLRDVDLVALDLPGHGLSGHRPDGAWYHFVDYASDVLAAADALGWARFTLLGHSLGGAVSSAIAAAVPERVDALWLIEGLGPVPTPAERVPTMLGQALRERATHATKALRVFGTIEHAIAARRDGMTKLSDEAARAIVSRGLREVEGGWSWRSDPRLTLASALRYDEAQVLALLGAIECPTLMVLADPPAPYVDAVSMQRRAETVRNGRLVRLHGTHHLHFERAAEIAEEIERFRQEFATRTPAAVSSRQS